MCSNWRNTLIRTKEYLIYLIRARFWKGYGIHSPAVFELVSKALHAKMASADREKINIFTKKISSDHRTVLFNEIGAGSQVFKGNTRKVSDIVRYSGNTKKYARVLFRLVNYYQPKCIIELGTSVGISSICMALANKKAVVHTIEGNKQVMEIAMEYAQSINIHSINFYHGMFDEVLPKLLLTVQTPEFVFIDGNHTYEATLKYYKYFKKYVQKGILVFDDIYWSAEMKKAWMAIMEDAVITIDLYKLGIVVIDEMLTPGNYRVRY